jgi:uncharacterized RDD family membrane protein YckC
VIASPTPQPSGARPLPSWERLAAAVIDFVVLLIPQVILATLIAGPQYSRLFAYATAHARESNLAKDPHFVRLADRLTPALLHYGISAAAVTAIYLIGMYLGAGATLGKLALGLRITRVDGRPMTVRDAVLRSLVFWVGSPFMPVIGVWIWLVQFIGGTLVLLFRPDHRAPEDLIGGTIVVRKEQSGRPLSELLSYRRPYVPADQPPNAPPARGGHLPGWGPASDQPPPPPRGGEEEAPS